VAVVVLVAETLTPEHLVLVVVAVAEVPLLENSSSMSRGNRQSRSP
jgi:hypothetical protein